MQTYLADLFVGTQVFTPIQDSFSSETKGAQGVFLIGSAFCFVGAAIAWVLIPNREKELEGEDLKFRQYLIENGYQTDFGESIESQVAKSKFKLDSKS